MLLPHYLFKSQQWSQIVSRALANSSSGHEAYVRPSLRGRASMRFPCQHVFLLHCTLLTREKLCLSRAYASPVVIGVATWRCRLLFAGDCVRLHLFQSSAVSLSSFSSVVSHERRSSYGLSSTLRTWKATCPAAMFARIRAAGTLRRAVTGRKETKGSVVQSKGQLTFPSLGNL